MEKMPNVLYKDWHDANDLRALSLVSIVYIYSLGKKFMYERLVKIQKKEKRHVSNFSTLSIEDMKTKKKHKSVLLV